jgi:hypothetical protein
MFDTELNFTYSKQDCINAFRLHYKNILRLKLDCAAILMAVAAGSWQWMMFGPNNASYLFLGAAAFMSLMLYAAFFVLPALIYKRNEQWKRPYYLLFSDRNIHFKTDTIDSHLEWSTYSKVLHDAHSYLLYYGKSHFTIIPKRLFASTEELQQFEQMLSEKVAG